MLISLFLTAAPLLLSDTIPVPDIDVLGDPIDGFELAGDAVLTPEAVEGLGFTGDAVGVPEAFYGLELATDAGAAPQPIGGFELAGDAIVMPEAIDGPESAGDEGAMPGVVNSFELAGDAVVMPEAIDGLEFVGDDSAMPGAIESFDFADDAGGVPAEVDSYEFAGDAGVVPEAVNSYEFAGDAGAVPAPIDGLEVAGDAAGVMPEAVDDFDFAGDAPHVSEPIEFSEYTGDAGVVTESTTSVEYAGDAVVSEPSPAEIYSELVLLGEPVRVATYVAEEPPPPPAPARPLPFQVNAAMPFPAEGLPGLPVHLIDMPVEMGFTPSELQRAVGSVYAEMYRGQFPGAALAIGRWGSTVIEQGFGTLDRSPGSPTVDPDYAIYDLASLTKVVATTTAVMLLHEEGLIHLDMPVSHYLPGFSGGDKDAVTIRQLLTHTSGLPAGGDTSGPTPDASLWKAVTTPLKTRPGQAVEYSDIGFIVLWAAAESAYGAPLTELLQTRVFEPLEMHMTSFQPGGSCIRCAPTAEQPGFRGIVHDPIARRLGGIAGNAGLFSTVHDLSIFAAMLANRGEINGVRVFRPETIDLFTQRQPGAGVRALGWETPAPSGTGAGGIRISSNAFGHTGFTGTSLWVDPQRGTWVVLLSNRTYDSGPNRMQALRRTLNDSVAIAVDQASD